MASQTDCHIDLTSTRADRIPDRIATMVGDARPFADQGDFLCRFDHPGHHRVRRNIDQRCVGQRSRQRIACGQRQMIGLDTDALCPPR